MVGRSRVRFHVRVLSLGFWAVLLGGVLLYATTRALAVVAGASTPSSAESAAVSTEPWLLGLARDGLLGALHVGAASVAAGVAAVLVGAWLLRSTVRAATP